MKPLPEFLVDGCRPVPTDVITRLRAIGAVTIRSVLLFVLLMLPTLRRLRGAARRVWILEGSTTRTVFPLTIL